MEMRFGQLYEGLMSIEKGLIRMQVDIANANCDYATKCWMEDEYFRIKGKYDSLLEMQMDFRQIELDLLVDKINDCLSCIDLVNIQ